MDDLAPHEWRSIAYYFVGYRGIFPSPRDFRPDRVNTHMLFSSSYIQDTSSDRDSSSHLRSSSSSSSLLV